MKAMRHPLFPLLAGLFGASLIVRTLTALTLPHAGYFDAFYYYHLAVNMAEGRGLVESVIWNYLDHPTHLPRPGNQYWMPLTNFWAWLGIVVAGGGLGPWRAAQLPFIVGSSFLPPLSAWLAWRSWRRRDWALSAGVLTLFSGFYFVYWVVTDSYTPFALAVALALLALWKAQGAEGGRWWVVAGIGAGLSHLTRVDGALLLPVIVLLAAMSAQRSRPHGKTRFVRLFWRRRRGYLLIIGRGGSGLGVTGTPYPRPRDQTLWMQSYDGIWPMDLDTDAPRCLAWASAPRCAPRVRRAWCRGSLIGLGAPQFSSSLRSHRPLRPRRHLASFAPSCSTPCSLLAMPLGVHLPCHARQPAPLRRGAACTWMMAWPRQGWSARCAGWQPRQIAVARRPRVLRQRLSRAGGANHPVPVRDGRLAATTPDRRRPR